MSRNKIIIQGFPGAFHEEAAIKYLDGVVPTIIPATTFRELAERLKNSDHDTKAIMAIENSIAGSLLQNYRILREYGFVICGEVYLRIRHNLMALPGQKIEDLTEVRSHPMAINQCLEFFRRYPEISLVETDDTALSAQEISTAHLQGVGGVGSIRAAELYGLEVLAQGIETSPYNYTRFFLIDKGRGHDASLMEGNKASIYLRVKDEPGQLLQAMNFLAEAQMNLSKLQSFPVLGKVGEYYFYLDIEFERMEAFWEVYAKIKAVTLELQILGIYKNAKVYDYQYSK
ncbi:MAG TPA: hypothetical protein ENK85_01700 [Saprospiraceae bacterium]|nr:hypothetical protein [Saprospiraceae bacterium]